MKLKFVGLTLILTMCAGSGYAQDAKAVMKQVLDRNDGTTLISRQLLSSCSYTKKNKKLICSERARVKEFESVRKDYGANEKDKKSASFILEPAAERGIGFLQYDYEQAGKESDQWMFLSALGKVKRIVSGNENEPKKGSFFGSELSYEDLEQRHLNDYTYRLLKSVVYRKRECWIIESLPTAQKLKKSNYSRSISWIDKERFIPLKTVKIDRQDKPVKHVTLSKVESIDGVWLPLQMTVLNVQTQRMSTLKSKQVSINAHVTDDFLTLRSLNDGAFRENHLGKFRAKLK